jgi:hypothetical protein
VLVIHTRHDAEAESSAYVEGLRMRAPPGRVFFSLKPVARQEYDALIDAAEVGLAFYIATGDSSFTQRNIQTIGLSSGKLAYYLRAGLPSIVNQSASVAPILDAAGAGIAVRDASHIGTALSRLAVDYDRYSLAACQFFDAKLDFGRAFQQVVERLDAVAAGA